MSLNDKGKYRNWNLLVFAILLLLALGIAGLHQFVESGFDTSTLFTSEWWWGLIQKVAVNFVVLASTIWYWLSELDQSDEELNIKKVEVTGQVNKDVDPVTFDPFMVKYNRNRKLMQYRKNINKELRRLEKKATEQDLRDWALVPKPDTTYCTRKQELMDKMSTAYTNEHIDNITIRYNAISPQFVTAGYNRNNQKEEQYVESGFWKMIRDLSPRFVSTFIYLLAVNSIFIRSVGAEDPVSAVLGFLLNIIAILIQYYIGRGYAKRYKDEKLLVDLRTRLEIIGLYLDHIKTSKGVE